MLAMRFPFTTKFKMTSTNIGNTFKLEYKTIGLIEIYELGERYVIILSRERII